MDKNKQYGNAMTKPLPYGCINKEKAMPSLKKFNFILEILSTNDKIGNLSLVDICFSQNTANERNVIV